jgi:hypothetical protein
VARLALKEIPDWILAIDEETTEEELKEKFESDSEGFFAHYPVSKRGHDY